MSLIKPHPSNPDKTMIPQQEFWTCLIDGADKQKVTSSFVGPRSGTYYLEHFRSYVESKGETLKEYCKKYLGIQWPCCPITGNEVGYRIEGVGLVLQRFVKGKMSKEHCPKFKLACQKFSSERTGSGNPMFGKEAWNKGKTAESDERLAKVAEGRKGTKASEETRVKQRLARALSPVKARHTTPHTQKMKEAMSRDIASRYAKGVYSRKTQIHKDVESMLTSLGIKFESEFNLLMFSIDIAIPELKIAIEIDGDFYHCNPKKYPSGPVSQMQKKNLKRDAAKNSFLKNRGWAVLRYWESDIKSKDFLQTLICDCKRLNLLPE